jgi:DNA-binding transcriptional ArsR family regulator
MGAISALVLVTGSAFVFMMRKRRKDRETGENDTHKAGRPLGAELPDVSNSIETTRSFQDVFNSGSNRFVDNSKEESEPGEVLSMTSLPEDMLGDKMMARAIVVGSELNAVLETLTPRERSIMETLIKHGGRMTQMDMRYETGVPKSTLTMVLISLEKRNLVTRKEYGRTNVIELSERFFSGEKHS